MTFMSYDLACVKYDILEGSVNFNSSVCIITFGNIYTCTTDESSRLRSAAVHVKVIRISDHWGPSTASADSYMYRNKTQRHAMFSNTHKHCQEKKQNSTFCGTSGDHKHCAGKSTRNLFAMFIILLFWWRRFVTRPETSGRSFIARTTRAHH